MDISDISFALQHIRPGASWVLKGTTLSDLIWLDSVQTRPTDSEITDAISNASSFQIQDSRNAAVSNFNSSSDAINKLQRAVVLVILDEINLIRGLLVPSQQPRTIAQLKTAIQNKINSGAAD